MIKKLPTRYAEGYVENEMIHGCNEICESMGLDEDLTEPIAKKRRRPKKKTGKETQR